MVLKKSFPIHFFSHNVFHSYISLVRQNGTLCGIGLKPMVVLYDIEKSRTIPPPPTTAPPTIFPLDPDTNPNPNPNLTLIQLTQT